MDNQTNGDAELEYGPEGWISLTDVFLLSAIVFLVFVLSLHAVAQAQRVTIRQKEDEIVELNGTLEDLAQHVNDIERRVGVQELQGGENTKQIESNTSLVNEFKNRLKGFKSFEDAKSELQNQLVNLSDEIGVLRGFLGSQGSQLKQVADAVGTNRSDLTSMQTRLAILENHLSPRELIGLKGEYKRVVFVFDRSGSMRNRWDKTVEVLSTWLNYMPVSDCVLITFNDFIESYPPTGLLNLQNEDAPQQREEMINWLKNKKPEGLTNTLGALQRAYEIEGVTMIVLFTDGAPRTIETQKSDSIDEEMVEDIRKLTSKDENKKIPLNTVGLGEFYRDKKLTLFLLELANTSGGAFLAK